MAKIDIISGFLGAGKTTLIKKLLGEALKGQQVVLIENEQMCIRDSFWTVVNVLVLFVALRHFLIKPVMGVIEQRNEMIRQQFNAAQKTQDEANKMKADYEQQLDTAKEQAADIIAAARVRSEKEHSKAIADTAVSYTHLDVYKRQIKYQKPNQ